MSDDRTPERDVAGRRLIRGSLHAALATNLDGRPYASLVACACAMDASPLLLLSDLAQHTANLQADPLVSLLFEASGERPDPLAAPRLTLLGRAEPTDDPRARSRFVARHPASAVYAGFADFRMYRVAIERAHLVAGFGRIAWIEADELRFSKDAAALAAGEAEILAHMNREHADAVALYAQRLLARQGGDWLLTGIDPEGLDLRAGADTARLDFDAPVPTPAAARHALAALAEKARQTATQPQPPRAT